MASKPTTPAFSIVPVQPTTPAPVPPVTTPTFISVERLGALGLDPGTAKQAMADAATVRQLIQDQTLQTQDALLTALVPTWGPDTANRLNTALALLQRMNLVFQVN